MSAPSDCLLTQSRGHTGCIPIVRYWKYWSRTKTEMSGGRSSKKESTPLHSVLSRSALTFSNMTKSSQLTRQSAPQRDIVLCKQGDSLFEQGRFIQAAQCYAKSSRSFEYVCLRFVDVDERDALRIYLSDRLDLLDKRVSLASSGVPSRVLIS